MDESRGEPATAQPCICGSPDHHPLREPSGGDEVGFLRCPRRELPRYAARGLETVRRGICWAAHPDTGVHCTLEPHDVDVDHLNAYVGRPWPAEPIPRV